MRRSLAALTIVPSAFLIVAVGSGCAARPTPTTRVAAPDPAAATTTVSSGWRDWAYPNATAYMSGDDRAALYAASTNDPLGDVLAHYDRVGDFRGKLGPTPRDGGGIGSMWPDAPWYWMVHVRQGFYLPIGGTPPSEVTFALRYEDRSITGFVSRDEPSGQTFIRIVYDVR